MAENYSRALLRAQAPEIEPLSLAEAKLYLRVDGSGDDETISRLITAAREAAEEFLRRSVAVQRWKLVYEDYAPLLTPLPRGPVLQVVSVTRRNRSGVEMSVEPELYHLNARADMLHFASVMLSHEVEILYETGYDEEQEVPASIRQGMLIHLAAMYESRTGEGVLSLPAAAICLYKPHRVLGI